MRFDVYGRFHVEVVRSGGRWLVYEIGGEGKRRSAGVVIPADTPAEAVPEFLDAYFHELARPGTSIRRLD